VVDLPTLWALLALADAVLAIVVGVGLHARPREGVAEWTGALAVRALAFLLFASGMQPHAGTLAVAAGLAALSMTLQAAALLAFDRRALPAWVHSAAVAAVAVPVALVAADPAVFRELAHFDALSGKTWNTPALAGNRLFLRNHLEMACYELPVAEK